MNEAFLCLGGNLGSRLGHLAMARNQITERCGAIIKQSALYESEAWGYRSENLFLNQIVKINTPLSAQKLMRELQRIEKQAGRIQGDKQYNNRTLDIDILFYNSEIIKSKRLCIPHPRLQLRRFVLMPLCEIEPLFVHPELNKTVKLLLSLCSDNSRVYKYKPSPYICVEGNIGAGKTTLASALAKKMSARFVPEKFEKNHLLPLFYETPAHYAFPLEYSFLLSRFEQLSSVLKNNRRAVMSDFSIYKCLWFARANLTVKEFKLFEKHFHAFDLHLPQPDLIIYITTPRNNLISNISRRGRNFESAISEAYLKKLDICYNAGFKKLKGPVIINLYVEKYDAKLTSVMLKTLEQLMKEKFGWPD